QLAPLHAHGFRHRQDELEPLGGGDERERNAGVSAGGLNEDAVLVDLPALQARLDHRVADAILDARKRIEELELEQDVRLRSMLLRGPVEAHERRIANGFGDVVVDAGHGYVSGLT